MLVYTRKIEKSLFWWSAAAALSPCMWGGFLIRFSPYGGGDIFTMWGPTCLLLFLSMWGRFSRTHPPYKNFCGRPYMVVESWIQVRHALQNSGRLQRRQAHQTRQKSVAEGGSHTSQYLTKGGGQ